MTHRNIYSLKINKSSSKMNKTHVYEMQGAKHLFKAVSKCTGNDLDPRYIPY